jgi:hypothetical protein
MQGEKHYGVLIVTNETIFQVVIVTNSSKGRALVGYKGRNTSRRCFGGGERQTGMLVTTSKPKTGGEFVLALPDEASTLSLMRLPRASGANPEP